MRRIVFALSILPVLATPTLAQNFEGNWGCRDATTGKAGILTIYGQVYGFASTVVGDKSSGTGTITPYQDGVGFNDGGLKATRAVQAGRIIPDPNYGSVIQLETADTIVMLCTPH